MREAEIPAMDPDPVEYPHAAEGKLDRDRWEPWRKAFVVVLVTHIAFLALAWAGSYYFGGVDGIPQEGLVDLWRRWDTEHYVDIAEFGYSSSETYEFSEAFFPLYPLTIRALALVGLNPVVAGMLISFAASIVALAFLYKLAEEDLWPGAGRRAILLLALFPTAVFLTAAYSESLFLAGAIPAFYFARRQRWHLVALPAAVAMGARVAGVFLLLGLATEFVHRRNLNRRHLMVALGAGAVALLPLIVYMLYLWSATNDPFYFVTAQNEGWQRELTNPLTALQTTWDTYQGDYASIWILAWRIEIAAAFAGIFFTGWAFKRREYGYGVYMGTLMLPLLTSSWYLSIPRMLLSMFPISLLLASVTRDDQRFSLTLATSSVFAALGVLVFTRGQWFF